MAAVLRRFWRMRVVAGLTAAAMAAILAAACTSAAGGRVGPQGSAHGGYQATIRRALPSVVEITAGGTTGSGVVFDHHGDIVTNAHVVGRNTRFEVRSSVTSRTMRARLVGLFAPDDLAVIKIGKASRQLKPVRWANSDNAQVGQIVLAMGSPYGLTDSVTQGIVSATGRTVTGPDVRGKTPAVIIDAVQTSAAINPGNSGGALVLLTGQVLGIPTLSATDPEFGRPADGIGFAIPANTVVSIARQLITKGKVTRSDRATLDITGETQVNSEHLPAGVAVTRAAPGGAAAAAGIKPGDVIAGVAGSPTPDVATLENVLVGFPPGQRVRVELLRGGNPRQVTVRLAPLGGPPTLPVKSSHATGSHAKGKTGLGNGKTNRAHGTSSPAPTRSRAEQRSSPHPSHG